MQSRRGLFGWAFAAVAAVTIVPLAKLWPEEAPIIAWLKETIAPAALGGESLEPLFEGKRVEMSLAEFRALYTKGKATGFYMDEFARVDVGRVDLEPMFPLETRFAHNGQVYYYHKAGGTEIICGSLPQSPDVWEV